MGSVSVYSLTSMTGQRPNMTVHHSVLWHSPLIQRKHTVGCRQYRDGGGVVSPEIMLYNGVVYCVKSRGPKTDP